MQLDLVQKRQRTAKDAHRLTCKCKYITIKQKVNSYVIVTETLCECHGTSHGNIYGHGVQDRLAMMISRMWPQYIKEPILFQNGGVHFDVRFQIKWHVCL